MPTCKDCKRKCINRRAMRCSECKKGIKKETIPYIRYTTRKQYQREEFLRSYPLQKERIEIEVKELYTKCIKILQ